MLTHAGCLQRRANLWKHIPESVDWLLIGDPRHVLYFSNFHINPLSFSANQRVLLLLTRDKAILLADNFARLASESEPYVDDEIIIQWYSHKKSVTNRDHALVQAIEACRHRWSNSRGVIETEGVTQLIAEKMASESEFEDPLTGQTTTIGNLVRGLRRQKLTDEVALLRRCMEATNAGHAAAFKMIRPGITELDVYFAIRQSAEQQAGCACVIYGDFRATNSHQFNAGGLPTDYQLQNGDLFIADYSVVINGYRSDFTNTMAVGIPTSDQLRQFEACRDGMIAAEATLRPGTTGKEVFEAASHVLIQRGLPALSHHCGHGLGLEHPEPPIFGSQSSDSLLIGDVVTLEPGSYVAGVGGMRFEHNYLVTGDGFERLSNHTIGLTR